MKLKITNLCDGFDGRDHFPKESDIGSIVTVVGVQIESGCSVLGIQSIGKLSAADRIQLFTDLDAGDAYRVYTCLAADGRILEVVQFEAESIGAPLWAE